MTLDGKPYTLDFDQARAVADAHKNTLVTARAGSGKTRVIVAKVAYLVAKGFARLDQISVFMFNRTAAAEVNQRLMTVEIDGQSLTATLPTVASTFHKFALDMVKLSGEHPQIISETANNQLIEHSLDNVLRKTSQKLSPKSRQELLGIVSNFIARAGQSFPGSSGMLALQQTIEKYCKLHHNQPEYQQKIRYHQLAFLVYKAYLSTFQSPLTNFNLLLSAASTTIMKADNDSAIYQQLSSLKYLMIDEYQDFSYLFFALVQAVRRLAPATKLFAVGDDWQAINRFAGSNVDYFLNFAKYFPEDNINIPLATNYRSCRRIVTHANNYMLNNYDSHAIPAIPKNHEPGKIRYYRPAKTKLDASDVKEDGLGDGRYLGALNPALPSKAAIGVAKLLKTLVKIIKKHPYTDIMILHRHNFTSFGGLTLGALTTALQNILEQEGIMPSESFRQQIRFLTMHRSKGLEAEVVILLEVNAEIVNHCHPHATIFELFGDNLASERADQQRLLYVALTRAKKYLYILSDDKNPPI